MSFFYFDVSNSTMFDHGIKTCNNLIPELKSMKNKNEKKSTKYKLINSINSWQQVSKQRKS